MKTQLLRSGLENCRNSTDQNSDPKPSKKCSQRCL